MKTLGVAFVGAFSLVPAAASADQGASASSTQPDKAACVAAHGSAQVSRAGRKLIEARESYVRCAHDACPVVIREDCSKGLGEVDEALPTMVLSARLDGKDATDAEVSLDGEPLAGGLDGRAIPVDPGPHVVRFERPGSGLVEVKLVAREGEKNRLVTGTFVLPGMKAEQTKREGTQIPVVPIAFAASGVLALGTAFVMHMNLTHRAEELHGPGGCAPMCPQSERDALSDQLVLRNVTLGVGLGAMVVAAVSYVFATRR